MRKLLLCVFTLLLCAGLCIALADEMVMGVGQSNIFADAGVKGVVYSSSDETIARVDSSSGRISALKAGECVIYAKSGGETVYSLSLTVLKAPTTLKVEYSSVQMMLGGSMPVQTVNVSEGEYNRNFVARVAGDAVNLNPDGTLNARSIGSATVYIYAYNDVFVKYEVKVRSAPTAIELSPQSIRLLEGDSTSVTYTLMPSYSYSTVSASVSNEGIIEFDEKSGIVSAKSAGKTALTLTCENGLSASVNIEVCESATSLIAPEQVTVGEGESGTICNVLNDGEMARLSYVSLTPETLRVDSDGNWTALKSGEATVRISIEGTYIYVDQIFTIIPQPHSISLSCEATALYIGQTVGCTVSVSPEGSSSSVTWSSSNPKVVAVSDSGIIAAIAQGSAQITAKAANGVSASVNITVLPQPSSVKLSTNYIELEIGESANLSAVFPPNTLANVEFISLDTSVVSVDSQSGLVSAVGSGSATVVCKTSNNLSAECLVTVKPDPNSVITELEVIFMDVDSNDSIVLRCGDEYAFIDSGNHIYGEKAAAFLKELGIEHLKYYIGTHAHLDHIGGCCVILDNFDVDLVVVPHEGVVYAIKACVWTESEKIATQNANYFVMQPGQSFYLGGARFMCIGPINIKNVERTDDDENSNSLVLRVDVGNVSLLLTGDGTVSEFNAIAAKYPDQLNVDVFKNTHHSGELSRSQLNLISPKITVFSTSSLHIPDQKYLNYLRSLGSEIYMTPTRVNGTIYLYTDGETITVTPEYEDNRNNWYNDITGKPK